MNDTKTTLESIRYFDLPATRFIGRDVQGGPKEFGEMWGRSGEFMPALEALREHHMADITEPCALMHFNNLRNDEPGNRMSYIIGRFMKAGTPVPDGYDVWDMPESTVGIGIIRGEFSELFKQGFGLTMNKIIADGYEIPYPENFFQAEVYVKENIPKEGVVSNLGLLFACRKKKEEGQVPTEFVGKPKGDVAAFSGARWPFSNVEPAVYAAAGLFYGRTERRDDSGAFVNDDMEYTIQNVLTGHAFGMFYCWPDDALGMAAYGLSSRRIDTKGVAEDDIQRAVRDAIASGNLVHIDEGNGRFDYLVWGYRDNGAVLLGHKFEHGNDGLNCAYDFAKPVAFEAWTKWFANPELFKVNGEKEGGVTVIIPERVKLAREEIYKRALAEGCRMFTRTDPPPAMDAERVHFCYGQAAYDAWIQLLERANAENSADFYFASPVFPHFIALYENRQHLHKFLNFYAKERGDANLRKAAEVCGKLKDLAAEGAQIGFENPNSKPEILAMSNNERRVLLIDILKQCRALELEIAGVLKAFLDTPENNLKNEETTQW